MRIAIVGTAPLSVDLAPYDDPEWMIWTCSPGNAFGRLRRVTEWFELHALREMTAPENKAMSLPYYAWLRTQPFPVWMQEKNDLVPQARVYPLDKMVERYGRNWFSSSVAYMMAWAITLMDGQPVGTKEIALFGIDMAHESEHYSAQRSGCTRFIEIAREHGINVSIPDESCLGVPPPMYGYNEATHMGRRLNAMVLQLTSQRAALAADIANKQLQLAAVDGNLQGLTYMTRTWVDGVEFLKGDTAKPPEVIRPSADPRVNDFKQASPGGLWVPPSPVDQQSLPEIGMLDGACSTVALSNGETGATAAPPPRRRGNGRAQREA